MSNRMAAPLALLALALGAGAAGAESRIVLEPTEGSLEGVSADSSALTFTNESSTFSVVCEAHRRIDFARSIQKTIGTHVGDVTAVTLRSCRNGRVTVLLLPWSIVYVSFSGTLPNISSLRLRIEEAAILVDPEEVLRLVRCLYRGDLEVRTASGTTVTTLTLDDRVRLPLQESLGVLDCPDDDLIVQGSLSLRPSIAMELA